MEYFGILAPQLGLKEDFPSIFLKNAHLKEGMNFMFDKGLIQRFRLRDKLFTPLLPDAILKYHLYEQRAGGANWFLMVLTKSDICYWDIAEDRYLFVTPQYAVDTASFLLGDATVSFGGGASTANLKSGDYITIGTTYSSDDKWYEILSITNDTELELTEDYAEANSGAVAYKARQTYAGTDTDYWSCVTFENQFYATNNGIGVVQEWPGTNQMVDITGLTDKYKYLYVFERHLLAINETNTPLPQEIASSDLGNAAVWGSGDGTLFYVDSSYQLTGAALVKGFLTIFTEKEIFRAWYVGGTLIYNNEKVVSGVGCSAPRSIVEGTGIVGCYFYSNDNKFRHYTGFSWDSISDNMLPTTASFHPTYEPNIQGLFVWEYNHIIWACPSSESSGYLDRLLVYDLDPGINQWAECEVDISCLGAFLSETTYTWATLPFASWDDWNWPRWDSRFEIANSPFVLAGGYDGYTWRLNFSDMDNAVEYNSYFRLVTDLMNKGGLHYRKRILELQVFVKYRSGKTLAIKVGRDDSGLSNCGSGSIALDGSASVGKVLRVVLPCDDSGHWFDYEFSSTGFYQFLGVIFGFDVIGER